MGATMCSVVSLGLPCVTTQPGNRYRQKGRMKERKDGKTDRTVGSLPKIRAARVHGITLHASSPIIQALEDVVTQPIAVRQVHLQYGECRNLRMTAKQVCL